MFFWAQKGFLFFFKKDDILLHDKGNLRTGEEAIFQEEDDRVFLYEGVSFFTKNKFSCFVLVIYMRLGVILVQLKK